MAQSFVKDKDHFCLLLGNWLPAIQTILWVPDCQARLPEDTAWASLAKIKLTQPSSAFPCSPKPLPQSHFLAPSQKLFLKLKNKSLWFLRNARGYLQTNVKGLPKDLLTPLTPTNSRPLPEDFIFDEGENYFSLLSNILWRTNYVTLINLWGQRYRSNSSTILL